jgi:hypothetical protein
MVVRDADETFIVLIMFIKFNAACTLVPLIGAGGGCANELITVDHPSSQ